MNLDDLYIETHESNDPERTQSRQENDDLVYELAKMLIDDEHDIEIGDHDSESISESVDSSHDADQTEEEELEIKDEYWGDLDSFPKNHQIYMQPQTT